MQGPKDKSYENKEWEFAVIDVSLRISQIAECSVCQIYIKKAAVADMTNYCVYAN